MKELAFFPSAFRMATNFTVQGNAQLEVVEVGSRAFGMVRSFVLENNPALRELAVFYDSFGSVPEVRLEGLSRLETVEVGENSFTHRNGTLVVRDCERLRELKVGAGSFELFTTLELSGLDALQTLELGDVEAVSGTFAAAALELKGGSGGRD